MEEDISALQRSMGSFIDCYILELAPTVVTSDTENALVCNFAFFIYY